MTTKVVPSAGALVMALTRDAAVGAGAVLDHDGLVEPLLHPLADDARDRVRQSAGRMRDDEFDGRRRRRGWACATDGARACRRQAWRAQQARRAIGTSWAPPTVTICGACRRADCAGNLGHFRRPAKHGGLRQSSREWRHEDDEAKPQPGLSAVKRITIDRDRTISFMGEDARVYATPRLISDIEFTCRDLIVQHADQARIRWGWRSRSSIWRRRSPAARWRSPCASRRSRAQGHLRRDGEGRARHRQRRHPHALRGRGRAHQGAAQGQGREARGARKVTPRALTFVCVVIRRQPPYTGHMAEERLILVDEKNRAVGIGGKTAVHRAGLLHRAFSIFIVDEQGRILLQRRSRQKYHSGGLLANSCCGHPRPGETTLVAARRRLHRGARHRGAADVRILQPLPRRARRRHAGERIRLRLFRAADRAARIPIPPKSSEVEFASADEITRRIARQPDGFVYWLRHYFENHGPQIARLAKRAARDVRTGCRQPDPAGASRPPRGDDSRRVLPYPVAISATTTRTGSNAMTSAHLSDAAPPRCRSARVRCRRRVGAEI